MRIELRENDGIPGRVKSDFQTYTAMVRHYRISYVNTGGAIISFPAKLLGGVVIMKLLYFGKSSLARACT